TQVKVFRIDVRDVPATVHQRLDKTVHPRLLDGSVHEQLDLREQFKVTVNEVLCLFAGDI
ncbi:hypothetical protein L0P02_14260, partial [Bifidobacterium longum]|nr:hypothetical protein [Bifidobacterium longum]